MSSSELQACGCQILMALSADGKSVSDTLNHRCDVIAKFRVIKVSAAVFEFVIGQSQSE